MRRLSEQISLCSDSSCLIKLVEKWIRKKALQTSTNNFITKKSVPKNYIANPTSENHNIFAKIKNRMNKSIREDKRMFPDKNKIIVEIQFQFSEFSIFLAGKKNEPVVRMN